MACMMMCVSIMTIAEKKLGQNDTNVIAKIAVNQTHHCCDQRGRDLRACVMEYFPSIASIYNKKQAIGNRQVAIVSLIDCL
jgi:hypothetical protein